MAFDLDDEELRATREMFGLKEIEDTKDIIIDKMAKFIEKQDIDEAICKNESKSSFENVRCCICGKEIKGIKKCENYVCDHCYNLK